MAQLKNTSINDTGTIQLPQGTTAQRPSSPEAGMIRYNTTTDETEYYNGSVWKSIEDTHPEATGGTIVDTDIGGVAYRLHYFTTTGNSTFTVTQAGEVDYIIVAGGGGAGSGGGGAGGLLTGTTTVTPQSYTITVGAGGTGGGRRTGGSGQLNATSGSNSSALGFTAIGGGRGGDTVSNGRGGADGGSGGGAGYDQDLDSEYGSGTAGQGNPGSKSNKAGYGGAGGGGGAGSQATIGFPDTSISGTPSTGGHGGQGALVNFTGTPKFYAGGGAGGSNTNATPLTVGRPQGGRGGGAHGTLADERSNTINTYQNGLPNTGGGGGGGDPEGVGGAGGSGIVIIRYKKNKSTTISPDRTEIATQPLVSVEPGRYFYNITGTTTGVQQFYLTTPFDVDTRVQVGLYIPTAAEDSDPTARLSRLDNFYMSPDGYHMYLCGTNLSAIYYTLTHPFDMATANYQYSEGPLWGGEATCFEITDSGRKLYINDSGAGAMVQYELSLPYDVRSRTETGRITGLSTGGCGEPAFNPDGTKLAFGERGSFIIRSGSCGTPFDISTFSLQATFNTPDADPSCCKWNADGTTLYVRHSSPDMVDEISTPTPYSVSGATFVKQVFNNPSYAAGGIDFNYGF